MARLSNIPFEQLDDDLQKVRHEYDQELGGSDFVGALSHEPDLFKRFIDYYLPLVSETRGKIDMRLTELTRLKVAEHNDCHL